MPHWNSRELEETCDVLRKDGWIKNQWNNDDGRCLLDAMYESYSRLGSSETRREQVNLAVRAALGHDNSGITRWNDVYSRTFAEVVAVLREADSSL